MRTIRPIIEVLIILLLSLVLYNPLCNLLSNTFTLFRIDNKEELIIKSYQTKIDSLEKAIFEYESSLESLNIYTSTSLVLSKIALRDMYSYYDFLIINTDTLVHTGSPVINEYGLVGLISNVNKNTATVSLLTGSPKVSIKVGKYYGLLNGYDKNNNLFLIHNINNKSKIEIGEKVYTSGLSNIDENIEIGIVERLEVNGVENTIYVKPSVDFDNLNYLMVLEK